MSLKAVKESPQFWELRKDSQEPDYGTNPMSVYVRSGGQSKTYAVSLDSRWTAHEWEQKYLTEGFREPDTELIIPPAMIETIAVRPLGNAPPVGSDNLTWLRQSVRETCDLAWM